MAFIQVFLHLLLLGLNKINLYWPNLLVLLYF